MLWNKDKLFCEINPTCYAISAEKEIFKRHIKNLFDKETVAKTFSTEKLPNIVAAKSSYLIKKSKGTDLTLQLNKVVNITLACEKLNGIIISPGEVFSFWALVGKISKKYGYLEGRAIHSGKLVPGIGGGLCNLGNTINLLVLDSPLDITEVHHHSDALSPDEGKRIPLSAGTSVRYNSLDFRFKNNTSQKFQLCLRVEDDTLFAELRSEKEIPYSYEITEEDHHFGKEGEKYYRISKIYRNKIEKPTGKVIEKDLIWDNHSEVMFDPELIPKEQLR